MSETEIPQFLSRPKAQELYNYLLKYGEQRSQDLVEAIPHIPYTTQRHQLGYLESVGYIKRRKVGRDVFWSIREAGQYTKHHVPNELKVFWPPAECELTIPEVIIDCQEIEKYKGGATTTAIYEYLNVMVRHALEYTNGDDSSVNPLMSRCRDFEEDLRQLQKKLPLLMQMVDSILLQPKFFSATEFVRSLIEENPNFPIDEMKRIVLMGDDRWTTEQLGSMGLYKSEWLEALFLYTWNKPLTEDQIRVILPNIAQNKEELIEHLRIVKHPTWDGATSDYAMFKKNKKSEWYYDEMSPARIKQVENLYYIAKQIRDSKVIPSILGNIICQEL